MATPNRLPDQPAETDSALAKRYAELMTKLRARHSSEPISKIERAYELASERHATQTRASGDPFFAHPLEVAHLLADMQLDWVCVATGLLHDTVEDTETTVEELKSIFGPEIARCVDGVTKLGRVGYRSSEARQAESYRKLLLAMTQDIRVVLVKLADRLHNMRTLTHLKPERQKQIALETREIYAPIALRLGMGKIRSELEDLAFSYLEPEDYQSVTRYIESRREASEEFLEETSAALVEKMRENEIPARIEGRIKRAYSIFKKLQRQRISLDEVYDLLAMRVITDSKRNCYAALGVIHDAWRPIPDRIKDFVAMPRPNLYQSLHTSVITDGGQRFEVQIRSEEMHQMAEEGICAHWKYKEQHSGPDNEDRRIAWLRQLVDWQQELDDPTDFLSTLKIDLYPEDVYVFTPQGRLLVLQRGATPVDFAYAVHTEVGHNCVGAKVNGRIVPLRYQLSNGEMVEITTQKGRGPSADWLGFVQTTRARHKIKAWLNARRREQAEAIGQRMLERAARKQKTSLARLDADDLMAAAHDYGYSQMSDLYAALGYGRVSAAQVLKKIERKHEPVAPPPVEEEEPQAPSRQEEQAPLIVRDVDDVMIYRARCCNPISGEPIVGYVTRGKGVAVHSRQCPNVRNLMYEAERRIEVAWDSSADVRFRTRLSIYVDDRPHILSELTNILSKEDVNIVKIDSRAAGAPAGPTMINLTVELANVVQLERITARFRQLAYVRDITRSVRI